MNEWTKEQLNISVKLEYLDRLIRMLDANKAEHERIKLICDSIEKDLGLGVEIPNEMRGLTKEEQEALRKVFKPKATHAVTGMYKREWGWEKGTPCTPFEPKQDE